MRENIYLAQLKPFFADGGTYDQYYMKRFNEDIKVIQLQEQCVEEEVKGLTIFQKYIMVNPQTSKHLPNFEVLFLVAALLEFVLLPYTIFLNADEILAVTLNVEIIIDCMWMLLIVISFIMAKEIDDLLEERWGKIAKAYLCSNFLFDFIPTCSVAFISTFPNAYYFRVIRMKRLGTMRTYVKNFWQRVGVRFEMSK